MIPAYVVPEIITPKGVSLRGLWFGPKKAKKVVVWVHGLGSSAFSRVKVYEQLQGRDTAILAFNNRGYERVSEVRQSRGKKTRWILAGSAHEKFTDCVDDIQGAVTFARNSGAKNIYLAGHSTGCQKSIYWTAKNGRGVKGVILLAPVSDYAGVLKKYGAAKLKRVTQYAHQLVRNGKPHELIPSSLWSEELDDAQRFLSLYTPDSVEEIFPYAQPKKRPSTLLKAQLPILVLWAENDEFSDRPAKQAVAWFEKNFKNKDKAIIVPKVGHSFRGAEKRVAKEILKFIQDS